MLPEEPLQLDREALLMLYAGGEMTAAQRAEFDAKLASDPALAADLQQIREAMARMEAGLRELDDRQRLPTNPAVAVRRAERAMQQWAVDRLRRPEPTPVPVRHMPWWSYPIAAAVILMVSFVIWSNRQPIGPTPADPRFQAAYMINDAEALAERLTAQFDIDELVAEETQAAADDPGAFFLNPAEVATW